jgi:hypothetical protein
LVALPDADGALPEKSMNLRDEVTTPEGAGPDEQYMFRRPSVNLPRANVCPKCGDSYIAIVCPICKIPIGLTAQAHKSGGRTIEQSDHPFLFYV